MADISAVFRTIESSKYNLAHSRFKGTGEYNT